MRGESLVPQRTRSSGMARQSTSRGTHHTFYLQLAFHRGATCPAPAAVPHNPRARRTMHLGRVPSLVSPLVPTMEPGGRLPSKAYMYTGVMRADDRSQERTLATTSSSSSGSARGVVHRVFELVPTLPISRFEEPWTPSPS